MKCLPFQTGYGTFFRAVYHIAKKRVSDAANVHAVLMGALGFKAAFDISVIPKTFQDLVMSHSGFSILEVHCHFLSLCGVPANGTFHYSFVICQIPMYNGPVAPGDAVVLELFCQIPVCQICLTDKKRAGRVFVNAVYNAGTEHAVDTG